MGTFLTIFIGLLLIGVYIRLKIEIGDDDLGDIVVIPIVIITCLVIGFIIYLNLDHLTISSKEEVCPVVKEEIVIYNGDTVRNTTYIYTFTKE